MRTLTCDSTNGRYDVTADTDDRSELIALPFYRDNAAVRVGAYVMMRRHEQIDRRQMLMGSESPIALLFLKSASADAAASPKLHGRQEL